MNLNPSRPLPVLALSVGKSFQFAEVVGGIKNVVQRNVQKV